MSWGRRGAGSGRATGAVRLARSRRQLVSGPCSSTEDGSRRVRTLGERLCAKGVLKCRRRWKVSTIRVERGMTGGCAEVSEGKAGEEDVSSWQVGRREGNGWARDGRRSCLCWGGSTARRGGVSQSRRSLWLQIAGQGRRRLVKAVGDQRLPSVGCRPGLPSPERREYPQRSLTPRPSTWTIGTTRTSGQADPCCAAACTQSSYYRHSSHLPSNPAHDIALRNSMHPRPRGADADAWCSQSRAAMVHHH